MLLSLVRTTIARPSSIASLLRTMSTSLSFTPERAADLRENIEGVLSEVRQESPSVRLPNLFA
jgi:hypothetical protein